MAPPSHPVSAPQVSFKVNHHQRAFVSNFYWICKWAAVSTRLRRAGRGPICERGVVTNLIFIRWSLQRTVEWYRSQALADKTWIHSIIRAEWRSPLRDRRMTISIVSLWWCKAAQAIRAPICAVVRRIMPALILMNILDLIVEEICVLLFSLQSYVFNCVTKS